jgi:hypothetical protein
VGENLAAAAPTRKEKCALGRLDDAGCAELGVETEAGYRFFGARAAAGLATPGTVRDSRLTRVAA